MNTVVYCCPFVPAEWIAAQRLRPVRIVPSGECGPTVRGSGAEPVGPPGIRDPKSELEVYAGMCPFARAFAGSALASAGTAAGVVLTTACDQMRRVADWLADRSPRPVFLMNVPSTCTPSARGLYAGELLRLGAFLVTLDGQSPSAEALRCAMLEQDAARASLRTGSAGLAEQSNKPGGHSIHPVNGETLRPGVPLALIGGPLLREDFELFDLIAAAGGRVVLDGTETGERTWPAPFDHDRLAADPFTELVESYFGTIPDAFRRPDSLLHDWLARQIAARGVRGVILHRYVWCDNWHAEVYRMKETLGVPLLDLDSSGGGRGGRARASARIEAFVEMLA